MKDNGTGDLFGNLPMDTLSVARRRLQANLDRGMVCPCCDRYARRYRRTLYSSQARQLISLYWMARREGWEKYFHRSVVIHEANNNDLAFLRHWKLLEQEPNADPTKKDSGSFRITLLGRQFVEQKTLVPKQCLQYNDQIEGFSEEMTDCRGVLGTRFNYDDLMRE